MDLKQANWGKDTRDVLIYDMGVGTLDVPLSIERDIFQLRATAGDDAQLRGEGIGKRIEDLCSVLGASIPHSHAGCVLSDLALWHRRTPHCDTTGAHQEACARARACSDRHAHTGHHGVRIRCSTGSTTRQAEFTCSVL